MLRLYGHYQDGNVIKIGEDPSIKATDDIQVDSGDCVLGFKLPDGYRRHKLPAMLRRGPWLLRVDIAMEPKEE